MVVVEPRGAVEDTPGNTWHRCLELVVLLTCVPLLSCLCLFSLVLHEFFCFLLTFFKSLIMMRFVYVGVFVFRSFGMYWLCGPYMTNFICENAKHSHRK